MMRHLRGRPVVTVLLGLAILLLPVLVTEVGARPVEPAQPGPPTTVPPTVVVEPAEPGDEPRPLPEPLPPGTVVEGGPADGPKVDLPGPPAAPSTATIEVTSSFAGYSTPGRAVPVLVEVTSEEPLRGTIELTSQGEAAPATVSQRVDVDAGATERHWFVAPPDANGWRSIEVALRDDQGWRPTEVTQDLIAGEDHELVGMLPDVAARTNWTEPWRTAPIPNTGLVFAAPVDPEMLALGPLTLDPLDQLVGNVTELADLGDDRLAAVLAWVDAGGQLMVTGDIDRLTDALPDGWAPAAGRSVRAGLGSVRSVGSDWFAELLPSPTRTDVEEGVLADGLRHGNTNGLELSLARDARAALKPAGPVWLGLVAYIVVVGPLVFLATRLLRRRTAAWAIVPAVALVCTTVTLTAGASLADAVSSTEVTVYETGPAGTRATTSAVLGNDGGDDVGARLPAGWSVTPASWSALHFEVSPSVVERHGDDGGDELTASTRRDGYHFVQAEGMVPDMRDALVVTATSEEDGVVHATVRNRLDVTLDHVVVLTGRTAGAEIGTLGPDEERDVTIEATTDFVWGEEPEPDLWRGRGLRVDAWAANVRRTGWNYRPLGQVVAAGWTDELAPRLDPTHSTADVGHALSVVVARTSVVPASDSGRLSDAAVVRSYLRGPATEIPRLAGRDPNRPAAEALADHDERQIFGILYGFELPATVDGERPPDPERLMLGIPDRYDAAEVWTARGWQRVEVPEPGAGQRAVPLPADAVVDGSRVLVRVAVPFQAEQPEPGHEFVLYESEQS